MSEKQVSFIRVNDITLQELANLVAKAIETYGPNALVKETNKLDIEAIPYGGIFIDAS